MNNNTTAPTPSKPYTPATAQGCRELAEIFRTDLPLEQDVAEERVAEAYRLEAHADALEAGYPTEDAHLDDLEA